MADQARHMNRPKTKETQLNTDTTPATDEHVEALANRIFMAGLGAVEL